MFSRLSDANFTMLNYARTQLHEYTNATRLIEENHHTLVHAAESTEALNAHSSRCLLQLTHWTNCN